MTMPAATIIRTVHNRDNPFVMVAKRTINNKKLSLAARGLLAWLLDKPDDFTIDPAKIAIANDISEYEAKKLLKELSTHKHLIPPQRQHINGRWQYTSYSLYEIPGQVAEPQTIEIQSCEIQSTEIQMTENSATVPEDLSRAETKHENAPPQITNTNNKKIQEQEKTKDKDNRPVVNQNTTPDPEPLVVSSVSVLPEITEIDLWEKDATAESDHEQYQPPEARSIVTVEIASAADSQSDNLDIIAGLQSGDKPLYVADKAWARISEAYDGAIGGTAGGKMQGLLEDGLELRGLDKVLALIASAGRASTSRYGYLLNSLTNWKTEPEQPKLPPKPKRPALDGVWSDDGELLGYDPERLTRDPT